jgi:7,8-dihydro-6-hydroxymethylpterin dimethyltransferase
MNEYLAATVSTCSICGKLLPARVHLRDGRVWFDKICPRHGDQSACIYGDADEYLGLSRYHRAGSIPLSFSARMDGPCPEACGLCPEHEQHVCMPILEITDACDLACPVCLVKNRASYNMDRSQVARILDGLIASEGQIDLLNLSGGEPTLSPHFREIVEECLSREQILRVSVSTNGLRLLRDPDLLAYLARRNVVISLQFDGFDEQACVQLRGRPLLQDKLRLIDRAGQLGAPMSLTATVVSGINDRDIARILDMLFERDNLLSVMFQPAAYTGKAAELSRPAQAVTIPDVIRRLDGARGGAIRAADFSPLPCSHPACFSLAFYLRLDDGSFMPAKRLVEIDRYLDIIQNRTFFGTDEQSFEAIRQATYELWSGPAGMTPDSEKALAAIRRMLREISCGGGFQPARALAAAERSIKSVFIHAFMDRHSFDLTRARKCCQVYPRLDGKLIPACVYNCLRR